MTVVRNMPPTANTDILAAINNGCFWVSGDGYCLIRAYAIVHPLIEFQSTRSKRVNCKCDKQNNCTSRNALCIPQAYDNAAVLKMCNLMAEAAVRKTMMKGKYWSTEKDKWVMDHENDTKKQKNIIKKNLEKPDRMRTFISEQTNRGVETEHTVARMPPSNIWLSQYNALMTLQYRVKIKKERLPWPIIMYYFKELDTIIKSLQYLMHCMSQDTMDQKH